MATALPFPVEPLSESFTAAEATDVSIIGLRLELTPARDEERESVMWWVDETLVLRNHGVDEVRLPLAVPNGWSVGERRAGADATDFWAEVYINGRRVETSGIRLVANPAHPSVEYGAGRLFELTLGSGESAHVRLVFGLPMDRTANGLRRLRYPFHLRRLWDGNIEAGIVVLRWADRMYSLRTNLPAYSFYGDRVEWFLHEFDPRGELDVQFLPRQEVFRMVARSVGCPMPWELLDRVSDGRPGAVREMLSTYRPDQLTLCADLPAALQGSVAAAHAAGLTDLRLEQFAPSGSGIEGPLIIPDPDFRREDLSEQEAVYTRFLRQEAELRRVEGTEGTE